MWREVPWKPPALLVGDSTSLSAQKVGVHPVGVQKVVRCSGWGSERMVKRESADLNGIYCGREVAFGKFAVVGEENCSKIIS